MKNKLTSDREVDLTIDDLEVICRVARERAALMARLRTALVTQDDRAALSLAREACGLPPELIRQ